MVVELLALGAPHHRVVLAVVVAEVLAQDVAALEQVERSVPAVRDTEFRHDFGPLFDHFAGVDAVPHAVVHTGGDGRHDEVGIGIGAGNPVLEPQVLLVGLRNPDRDDAVVDAPVGLDRREAVGTQAPVGIGVRAEDGRGIGHQLQESTDCVPQAGREGRQGHLFLALREVILAVLVDQAHVDVQAVARVFLEGLGHEAGDEAVFARGGLDDALEHHGVVARQDGVVDVVQVDLELAW